MSGTDSLTCYRVGCRGSLQYRGDKNDDLLYVCDECGTSLREPCVRQLAEESSPVGQLATALLERDSTS